MERELKKCECGKLPELQYCESDYYHKGKMYAYFCECGKVGGQSSSKRVAKDLWNKQCDNVIVYKTYNNKTEEQRRLLNASYSKIRDIK